MSKILDGILVAEELNNRTKNEVILLKSQNIYPHLAVVLVGDDPASNLYVTIKEKKCQELGIDFSRYNLPENCKEKDIIFLIDNLNKDNHITAIVVQLPLPEKFNTDKIIAKIIAKKDADSLNSNLVIAPTAAAIDEILSYYKIDLNNKKIALVGYGKLVGKPLEKLILKKYPRTSLVVCDSKTKNLSKITVKSDIVIAAVGKPHLITNKMIKNDAVVIDAGTSEKAGKITGDVDFDKIYKKTSYITPAKGGVGPVTVAKLLENVVSLSAKK